MDLVGWKSGVFPTGPGRSTGPCQFPNSGCRYAPRIGWQFGKNKGKNAIGVWEGTRSDRTMKRVWNRFQRAQSAIRTALLNRGPPPAWPADSPAASARRPAAAHVLAHLQSTFPQADCPIAAFQQATRSFFV